MSIIQNSAGSTQVSRFSVNGDDAAIANAASELKMLNLEQHFSNHNAGCLAFGPDGYLYIGLGEGGSGAIPATAHRILHYCMVPFYGWM